MKFIIYNLKIIKKKLNFKINKSASKKIMNSYSQVNNDPNANQQMQIE